jgi:hypothetical protein
MWITSLIFHAFFDDDRRMAPFAVREITECEADRTDKKYEAGEQYLFFIKRRPIFQIFHAVSITEGRLKKSKIILCHAEPREASFL